MEKGDSISAFTEGRAAVLCINREQNTYKGKLSYSLPLENRSKVGFVVWKQMHKKTECLSKIIQRKSQPEVFYSMKSYKNNIKGRSLYEALMLP